MDEYRLGQGGFMMEPRTLRGECLEPEASRFRVKPLAAAEGVVALADTRQGTLVPVEADADVLRVDLDQLAERVLEAAADGDGAAQGGVEVGELLPADGAGRVDAGPGLVDDDVGQLGHGVRERRRGGWGRGRAGRLGGRLRRDLDGVAARDGSSGGRRRRGDLALGRG